MEWNDKLQIIIDMIENHLQREEEPIDTDEIASIAGCSFDFFQKVFSYMNGISFSEYIRARKLTLAGYDLKGSNRKVVDISYQYGYDSPTSFTKAFQLFHGITPSEARDNTYQLHIQPKLQIAHKERYVWRIEQKTSFRLIGKQRKISESYEDRLREIPKFWDDCKQDGSFVDFISLDSLEPHGLFGFTQFHDEISYAIMVNSDKTLPLAYTECIIPSSTWAIFDCKGPVPHAIQNAWHFLQEEWLANYPFEHADIPALEWYSNGNTYDEDYASQIWIPIK